MKTIQGKLLGAFIVFVLLLVAEGCEESDCSLSSVSYCSMAFYDSEGKMVKLKDTISIATPLEGYDSIYTYHSATDTIVSQVPIDSLTSDKGYSLQVSCTRKKGILVNRRYGAERMELPLSFTTETDTFFIIYSARLADTLYICHQNLPYFTSMDCGTIMRYKLTGTTSTHHLIDSVQISQSDVTNTLQENVKIYYTVNN